MGIRVQWDARKSTANWKKHGVRISDVEVVLEDTKALTVEDLDAEGEQRFVSIGLDSLSRLVVVVYTYRGVQLRIISARRATRSETKAYARGI